MEIISEVIGNIHNPEWAEKLKDVALESIFLDQWTAQKSRFLAKSDLGNEFPIALKRHTQIVDGDIVAFDPEANTAVVLRLDLSPVLVIDLSGIAKDAPDDIIRIAVELGHAIGNQHWAAVIKGTKVYVPLTVDQKVMMSVLETHNIPGISFKFEAGQEVIPFLAPADMRRLFGGAGHENTDMEHHHGNVHSHVHSHGTLTHDHPHVHAHGTQEDHSHNHTHE